MKYLAARDILVVHALIVEDTGGSHGVREAGLLESIAMRPQASFGGRDVHDSVFAKVAALCEALVNYHVFVDGNKRTAFVAMSRFLALNGYSLEATQKEVEKTMVKVAEKQMDEKELAGWIEEHATSER